MKNLGIGIGAAIAAAIGIGYLVIKGKDAKNAIDYLSYSIKTHSINVSKGILNFKVDVAITNPSKTSISLEKPYIQILYNGSELTHSKPSSEIITITAQGDSIIKDIDFSISLLSNASVFINIFKTLALGSIDGFWDKVTNLISNVRSKLEQADNLIKGGNKPENNTTDNLTRISEILQNNANKVLEKFTVKILLYKNGIPITYETKLV